MTLATCTRKATALFTLPRTSRPTRTPSASRQGFWTVLLRALSAMAA